MFSHFFCFKRNENDYKNFERSIFVVYDKFEMIEYLRLTDLHLKKIILFDKHKNALLKKDKKNDSDSGEHY